MRLKTVIITGVTSLFGLVGCTKAQVGETGFQLRQSGLRPKRSRYDVFPLRYHTAED